MIFRIKILICVSLLDWSARYNDLTNQNTIQMSRQTGGSWFTLKNNKYGLWTDLMRFKGQ